VAWKYPKHRLAKNRPASVDEINEDLAAVAQESGRLNEHNWKNSAISNRTSLAHSASIRSSGVYQAVPHIDGEGIMWAVGGTGGSEGTKPNYYRQQTGHLDWSIVETVGFNTDNTLIWINASFQQMKFRGTGIDYLSLQYGLRIDGALLNETVTGTLERDGSLYPRYDVPITLDALVPVPAGSHTADLVVRGIRSPELLDETAFKSIFITNRELFVIELRR
jgi:hypothetical protein